MDDPRREAGPADLLLDWYARGRRVLPWRSDRSPYRVVVSEFMLQQTQVDRVIPAFERFIAAFGSFAELAAAPAGDVVRAWQGLGYNGRAVRLHRLARAVCDLHGGELPDDQAALLALPGVGPYTAAAIRAFAFDRDEPAVDTNVQRVVGRVRFGPEYERPASPKEIAAAAAGFIRTGRGNDGNSALMDLGSAICTARAPKCLICPLQSVCAAYPLDSATLAVRARAIHKPVVTYHKTTRYLRGRIVDALRALGPRETISLLDLSGTLASAVPNRSNGEIDAAIRALAADGLVRIVGDAVGLPY